MFHEELPIPLIRALDINIVILLGSVVCDDHLQDGTQFLTTTTIKKKKKKNGLTQHPVYYIY